MNWQQLSWLAIGCVLGCTVGALGIIIWLLASLVMAVIALQD